MDAGSHGRKEPIEAFIFDLDGTLVDTLQDLALAVNHVLTADGFPPHPVEAYRRFIGDGTHELVRRALPSDARAETQRLVANFRVQYGEHLLDHSACYPGIEAALGALTHGGLPMCVLSNKLDPLTKRMVGALLPQVPFAAVVGERPERPRKPDPEVALELMAAMGVQPSRCAIVGDSRFDMLTARAAGAYAVGVRWGLGEEAELLGSGCHAMVSAPEQLLEFIQTRVAPRR